MGRIRGHVTFNKCRQPSVRPNQESPCGIGVNQRTTDRDVSISYLSLISVWYSVESPKARSVDKVTPKDTADSQKFPRNEVESFELLAESPHPFYQV
jgi:hypothetical protein